MGGEFAISNQPLMGSEPTAAGGSTTWGPRKACFVGRGKAKAQLEFSACGKCNIVACALTKRVAAVGERRSCAVGKEITGHRNRGAKGERTFRNFAVGDDAYIVPRADVGIRP